MAMIKEICRKIILLLAGLTSLTSVLAAEGDALTDALEMAYEYIGPTGLEWILAFGLIFGACSVVAFSEERLKIPALIFGAVGSMVTGFWVTVVNPEIDLIMWTVNFTFLIVALFFALMAITMAKLFHAGEMDLTKGLFYMGIGALIAGFFLVSVEMAWGGLILILGIAGIVAGIIRWISGHLGGKITGRGILGLKEKEIRGTEGLEDAIANKDKKKFKKDALAQRQGYDKERKEIRKDRNLSQQSKQAINTIIGRQIANLDRATRMADVDRWRYVERYMDVVEELEEQKDGIFGGALAQGEKVAGVVLQEAEKAAPEAKKTDIVLRKIVKKEKAGRRRILRVKKLTKQQRELLKKTARVWENAANLFKNMLTHRSKRKFMNEFVANKKETLDGLEATKTITETIIENLKDRESFDHYMQRANILGLRKIYKGYKELKKQQNQGKKVGIDIGSTADLSKVTRYPYSQENRARKLLIRHLKLLSKAIDWERKIGTHIQKLKDHVTVATGFISEGKSGDATVVIKRMRKEFHALLKFISEFQEFDADLLKVDRVMQKLVIKAEKRYKKYRKKEKAKEKTAKRIRKSNIEEKERLAKIKQKSASKIGMSPGQRHIRRMKARVEAERKKTKTGKAIRLGPSKLGKAKTRTKVRIKRRLKPLQGDGDVIKESITPDKKNPKMLLVEQIVKTVKGTKRFRQKIEQGRLLRKLMASGGNLAGLLQRKFGEGPVEVTALPDDASGKMAVEVTEYTPPKNVKFEEIK